jgi:hypothetical protein
VDKSRIIQHFIGQYFRDSGTQEMEIAFLPIQATGEFVLESSYLDATGVVEYRYETAVVKKLGFSGLRRWAHLNSLLYRQ